MKAGKRESIAIALQAGIPVLIMGEPGIGKSRWVEGVGKQLGIPVETLIGATLLPEDVGGILAPSGEYILPGWFRRLQSAGRGLLFLDELTCAAPSVQAALLRLVAEKALQGERLPGGVGIIASANPADQAAGGWDLAAPLANRFCHMGWEVDPLEWSREFVNGFNGLKCPILPENWTDRLTEARALVSAYIRKNPAELQKFPKAANEQSGPWASARTWDYAATVMAAHKAAGLDDAAAVVGLVGEGTALQFLTWRHEMSLPEPEHVLERPELLPRREDQAFVTLIAVAAMAVSRGDLRNWQQAWAVLGVATQRGLTDVAAPAAMVLADPKNQPPKAPAPKEAAAFLPLWVASGMINITNNNSVGSAPPPKTQKSPVTQMRLNPMPGKISASITKAQLATLRIPGGVRFDCDAPQGWLDRFDSETRNTMARTCVVAFPTDHPEGVIVDLVSGKMFANVNGYRAPAPSHSQQPLGQGIQAVSR